MQVVCNSQFIEMFGDPLKNPRHLPQFRLEKFIHFLTSGSRGWAKYYSEDGEWFITITNVKNCKVSIDNIQRICPPHNAEAERTRVKEGDLLISVTADLGRTGVITKEIADHGAYINQHLTCIRLEQSALDPTYVAYFMETEAGKKQFFEKNLSSVKAGLNFDSIRSLRLLVPPLEQQKEFVNFLQQSDKSKFAVLNCISVKAVTGRIIMDREKCLILINGQDRTDSVKESRPCGDSCDIVYTSSPQVYHYQDGKVKILELQQCVDPAGLIVTVRGIRMTQVDMILGKH